MILDTSVLVDIDRGVNETKIERLDRAGPHSISSVTVAEFYAGVYLGTGENDLQAEKMLGNVKEVSMEGEIAREAGRLIGRKAEGELSAGLNDIYIAATALALGEPVLTRDIEDFEEIDVVDVVDWSEF